MTEIVWIIVFLSIVIYLRFDTCDLFFNEYQGLKIPFK